MRRIIAGKKGRRGVAWILAVSLCLTGGFTGVGREPAERTALAAEQTSEEEVWEYEETTLEEVAITGYKGTDTRLHIPETIQNSQGDSLAVTEIADNAFKDCTNLISVEIPGSVTKIGSGILSGCSNIREITVSEENQYYDSREACNAIIEKDTNKLVAGCQTSQIPNDIEIIGEYAFAGCTMLTDVTFPAGLTKIESSAFEGCSGITGIEIPASVSTIGARVFAGCDLEEIKVDEENQYYDSRDNCNAIIDSSSTSFTRLVCGCKNTTIPEGVEVICPYAFEGCTGLESIRIPSTVLEIVSYTFWDCPNLQQIDFAEEISVWDIDSYAFSGCEKLKSISLPPGITVVRPHTFDGCSSLERIEVPEGVTELYYRAFEGCSALKEVNLPESLTSIEQSAFSGCTSLSVVNIPSGITVLETGVFRGCTSLTEIEIPSSITKICSMAFSGCTSLTAVEIPDSVTEMGESVFEGCDSLTRVDLPDGMTRIPGSTFASCSKLAEVGFPSALTEIGGSAFRECGLRSLEIPEGVTKLENSAFYRACNLKEIKLPDTLESIGDGVFVSAGLESLRIPKNVSVIGDRLFDGEDYSPDDWFTSIRQITVDEENETYDSRDNCNAIIETKTDTLLFGSNTTTKIPEGVKTIGMFAFSGCKDLESIEISSTVSMIAGHVFTRCNSLSKITVSEDNPKYSSREGCNAVFQGNKLVVGCKATKIPSDVSSLELAAFSGCSALTEIELPSGLRSIPDMAFMACTGLKSIKIPYGVTNINHSAFSRCKSLESVYIPSTVTTFGAYSNTMENVFAGCYNLTIYTTEGAEAVEFAEKFGIPYSFEAMPVATPTPGPEGTPTPGPEGTPTPGPQATPTPGPEGTPTPGPGGTPTPGPQDTSTPGPQGTPTSKPQVTPTPRPQVTAKPDIKKPAKPSIKKLRNKSGKKVTVTLSKKVAGATGYQVAYSVKSSMKGQKLKSFKGTSVTVKGLKKKKTYYFRVRAYVKKNGETVYGSWGKKKKIKIKK